MFLLSFYRTFEQFGSVFGSGPGLVLDSPFRVHLLQRTLFTLKGRPCSAQRPLFCTIWTPNGSQNQSLDQDQVTKFRFHTDHRVLVSGPLVSAGLESNVRHSDLNWVQKNHDPKHRIWSTTEWVKNRSNGPKTRTRTRTRTGFWLKLCSGTFNEPSRTRMIQTVYFILFYLTFIFQSLRSFFLQCWPSCGPKPLQNHEKPEPDQTGSDYVLINPEPEGVLVSFRFWWFHVNRKWGAPAAVPVTGSVGPGCW